MSGREPYLTRLLRRHASRCERMGTRPGEGSWTFAVQDIRKELTAPLSSETTAAAAMTKNKKLIAWVEKFAALTQPDSIHWCDGSAEEYDRLCQELIEKGTFERLSDAKHPNSYLASSD